MKHTVSAICVPVLVYVGSHCPVMNVFPIEICRKIMFHTVFYHSIFLIVAFHWQVGSELFIYFHFLLITFNFIKRLYLQSVHRSYSPNFFLLVCCNHIRVEGKHILVGNGICYGVFVQHVSEECFCFYLVLCIFIKHWCSCESKKQGSRECVFDCLKHSAIYRAVTLINH